MLINTISFLESTRFLCRRLITPLCEGLICQKVYTHYSETVSNQRLLESIKQLHVIDSSASQRDSSTNVTQDDEVLTGKIALAHQNEFPDYYTRLQQMETVFSVLQYNTKKSVAEDKDTLNVRMTKSNSYPSSLPKAIIDLYMTMVW